MPKGRPLSSVQRSRVAEKIMEWGNLVFVGLVISQLVPGPLFNPWYVGIGIVSVAGAYSLAAWMMRGGEE